MIDYLALGHITRDLLSDGSYAPGGTVLYATLTAAALGYTAAIVSAPAPLPAAFPKTIAVASTASAATSIFENRYTPTGRTQLLHAVGAPLAVSDIPPAWRSAPIVHLAPISAETPPALIDAFPNALIGITPQGYMRTWGASLPDRVRYQPWQPPAALLARADAIVLSIEDVHGDEALVTGWARGCRLLALTRGALGATLFINGEPHEIAPFPAVERDPTGAGDVFAAALLIGLRERGTPLAAACFAAAAAACSVEASGAASIPTRDQVEARMHGTA